jgi:hypothetical protein
MGMAISEDDRDLPPWVENVMGFAVRKVGDLFIPFIRCGEGRYHFFRQARYILNFATRAEAVAFCRDFRDRRRADAPEGELVYVVEPDKYYARTMARKDLCTLCTPDQRVFVDSQEARRFAQRLQRRSQRQWFKQTYPERALARRISKVDRRDLYEEWEESGRRCGICGEVVAEGQLTHVDHVRPVADGGTRDRANLRVTHSLCNMTRNRREWRARANPDPRVRVIPRLNS